MLSIYKNERTNHTYQTEKRGCWFVITERDYMGEQPQILSKHDTRGKAQDVLDRLADSMDWKYCGRQSENEH